MILYLLYITFLLFGKSFGNDVSTSVFYARSITNSSFLKTCVILDNATKNLSTTVDTAKFWDLEDFSQQTGCQAFPPSVSGRAVIVDWGSCSWKQKAMNLRKAKGAALFILTNKSYVISNPYPEGLTGPPVVFLLRRDHNTLQNFGKIQIALYRLTNECMPTHDLTMHVVFAIPIFCIFLGSVLAHLTKVDLVPDAANQITKVPMWSYVVLLGTMSGMLLLMYFFFNIMVWILIVIFVIAGAWCVLSLLQEFVIRVLHIPDKILDVRIPKCFNGISVQGLVLYPVCLAFTIVWAVYRKEFAGIILQDIIGACLCITLIKMSAHSKSLMIYTILLSCVFVYDIFFVFITPFFGGKSSSPPNAPATRARRSVDDLDGLKPISPGNSEGGSIMEGIATGSAGTNNEKVPLLFIVPRIFVGGITADQGVCLPISSSMLGFGDIVLPGLLIAYLLTFDRLWHIRGCLYFIVSMIGYMVGLGFCFLALSLMQVAQPALLYIVPCILIPTFTLGFIRGDIKRLWTGAEPPSVPCDTNDPEPIPDYPNETYGLKTDDDHPDTKQHNDLSNIIQPIDTE